METEEEAKEPAGARPALVRFAFLAGGVALALASFLLLLVGFFGLTVSKEEFAEIASSFAGTVYWFRAWSGMIMALGAYWLWAGFELCRGRFALVADARSFVVGNFALAAGTFFASDSLSEFMHAADPAASPAAGAVFGVVSALWLWTAAKLLSGNKAPIADLRMFIGGNAALGAALSIMLFGLSIIAAGFGMMAAKIACIVAGIVLLALAAQLLRGTAQRERSDDDGGQAAAEQA